MSKQPPLPPIIVLGMHRSGTTMVTRLLQEVGVFIGHKKYHNLEAVYFQQLNQWVLDQLNLSWDRPGDGIIHGEFAVENMKRVLEGHLNGFGRHQFLGWNKFIQYGNIREMDIPWGWKDPKNTLTIGLWKKIFPAAKIVTICRNPIDVAASLKVREEQLQQRFQTRGGAVKRERNLDSKWIYNQSNRILNFREGINLWGEYNVLVKDVGEKYGSDVLQLQYESFLEQPAEKLAELTKFVGVKVRAGAIETAVKDIDKSRQYAFLEKPELVEEYRRICDDALVRTLGYGNLTASR